MCQRIDSGDKRAEIAPRLRHALYLRDRHTCLYCGRKVELSGMFAASLEHLTCWSHDGADDAANLFVCCASCNSSRNDQDLRTWCREVGIDYRRTMREARLRRRRVINLRKGSIEHKRVKALRKAARLAKLAS